MTQTNASNFCYECRHIEASMHSHTHTPVSYTHLDVYKRQLWDVLCVRAPLRECDWVVVCVRKRLCYS